MVVQLICPRNSYSMAISSILLGFHGTAVVNIVDYDHVYLVYPYSTFVMKENASRQKYIRNKERGWFRKYRDRGWRFVPWRQRGEMISTRCLGDKFCWAFNLQFLLGDKCVERKEFKELVFICTTHRTEEVRECFEE
jgi:hypothetical protein